MEADALGVADYTVGNVTLIRTNDIQMAPVQEHNRHSHSVSRPPSVPMIPEESGAMSPVDNTFPNDSGAPTTSRSSGRSGEEPKTNFATFEGEVFVAKEGRVWHVQDSYSTAGTLSIDESETSSKKSLDSNEPLVRGSRELPDLMASSVDSSDSEEIFTMNI